MDKERMPKVKKPKSPQLEPKQRADERSAEAPAERSGLAHLHRHIGNQGVQRLLAQRSGEGGAELDAETTSRIDRARGDGHPLDRSVQGEMSQAMGHDLSGVRAHTSREADSLSRRLGAKAFTTGQDIFFRQDAYDPQSTSGQELIAHELTHVVQQGTGTVASGGKMTVSEPGDAYEQQADATASAVVGAGTQASVQRQEEEEMVQMQEDPVEEDMLQMQEEEEMVQMQDEVEEDVLQMQEEEELQMQEEEELQMQPIEEEEEEMQP